MNEKDRILELVKKEIISSQEAIVLLEQLGKKVATQSTEEDTTQQNKDIDFEKKIIINIGGENKDDEHEELVEHLEDTIEDSEEALEDLEEKIEDLEDEIEEIETEIEEIEAEMEEAAEEEDEVLVEVHQKKLERLKKRLEELYQSKVLLDEEVQNQESLLDDKRQELEALLKKMKKKIEETDWRQATNDSFTQLGGLVGRTAGQFARAVSETVRNVTETIQFESDGLRYRAANFKVKTDYHYEQEMGTASIVEVKVANGDVKIKTAEQDEVTIEGEIRVDGEFDSKLELEHFVEERINARIEQDTFVFSIPSKKIYADVTIILPVKIYDYVAVRGLNASIRLKELQGKDFYLDSRNGDISLKEVNGTMLEINSTNGNFAQFGGTFKDVLAKVTNGNLLLAGEVLSADLQNVNGNIKTRISQQETKKIAAKTVNGNVTFEVALPLELEADLKTSLGSLTYNREAFEVLRQEKDTVSQAVVLQKQEKFVPVQLRGRTTTGSVKLIQVQCTNE